MLPCCIFRWWHKLRYDRWHMGIFRCFCVLSPEYHYHYYRNFALLTFTVCVGIVLKGALESSFDKSSSTTAVTDELLIFMQISVFNVAVEYWLFAFGTWNIN